MARVRACLRGVSPDVARELEQEIAAHIDDALAARHGSAADVSGVLDRLGPPEEYARDLALYLMVDRGYRDWSLPHMVRSTAFWGLSTVAGGIVVMAFAGLFFVGILTMVAGVARWGRLGAAAASWAPGAPPSLLVVFGMAVVVAAAALSRWFIGQYVRRARPHAFGLEAAATGWADRALRRIVLSAATGAVAAVVGAVAAGLTTGTASGSALARDALASPGGILAIAGIGLVLLSPVVGLLWSAWAEGP